MSLFVCSDRGVDPEGGDDDLGTFDLREVVGESGYAIKLLRRGHAHGERNGRDVHPISGLRLLSTRFHSDRSQEVDLHAASTSMTKSRITRPSRRTGSAHGDQLISAKPRGTARFLSDLHM